MSEVKKKKVHTPRRSRADKRANISKGYALLFDLMYHKHDVDKFLSAYENHLDFFDNVAGEKIRKQAIELQNEFFKQRIVHLGGEKQKMLDFLELQIKDLDREQVYPGVVSVCRIALRYMRGEFE